jgi:hypothetical protein
MSSVHGTDYLWLALFSACEERHELGVFGVVSVLYGQLLWYHHHSFLLLLRGTSGFKSSPIFNSDAGLDLQREMCKCET